MFLKVHLKKIKIIDKAMKENKLITSHNYYKCNMGMMDRKMKKKEKRSKKTMNIIDLILLP